MTPRGDGARVSTRRRLLLGAAAGIAAAGGILAWRHRQQRRPDDDGAESAIDFWSLRLARPEGGELEMAQFRHHPLLINFWATWCAPCVRELPEIDRFARDLAPRGIRAIGLAIDGLGPVREFLQRQPLSLPIGLIGVAGSDLVRQFGNLKGGLPFTVLLASDGRPVQRKLGETSYAELAEWVRSLT